jgi:hypothetical protein
MLQPLPVRPEYNGRAGITFLAQYRKPKAQREAEPLQTLTLLQVRMECSGRAGTTFLTEYRTAEAQREAEPLPMLTLLRVRMECSGRVGTTFLTNHRNSEGDLIDSKRTDFHGRSQRIEAEAIFYSGDLSDAR